MTIKNQDIICDPCLDSLRLSWPNDEEIVSKYGGKYINIDDFSERQLSKCVVCYECNHLIWDGEDCWDHPLLKNNCKSCGLDRTFARG